MNRRTGFSYEVALPGEFGQAYLATFADLGVRRATASSVFLLAVHGAEAVPEIAAMLQARGLTILGIRRVGTRDDEPASRTRVLTTQPSDAPRQPVLVDDGPCLFTARNRVGAPLGAPTVAASHRPPRCATARPAPTGSPG